MTENIEFLDRMKLIMNYDVSKTLSENTVNEQIIVSPASSIFKFTEWMKTWNTHDWFFLVQMILLFLGFATGGATSLVAFLLAIGVDLAEAMVYVSEGDPYSAVMVAILAIIPANELLKLPGIRDILQRRGIDGIKKLIKKNKKGEKLTPDEIKDLKIFGEKIVGEAENIKILFGKSIRRIIASYVKTKSTKWILTFLLAIKKTKTPIMIAGVAIPFDYLYMYVYRDDIEKMNLRNNSFVMKIINWVGEQIGWIEVTPDDLTKEVNDSVGNLDISEFPSVPYNENPKVNDTLVNRYGK
jgi:hypothetical protein